MSNSSKNSWLFFDYNPEKGSTDKVDEMETKINEIHSKLEHLENSVIPKITELDKKLDRLINSNKSLIAYFSAINDRDVRELNYRIRGFSSKKKQIPPVNFVPERSGQKL